MPQSLRLLCSGVRILIAPTGVIGCSNRWTRMGYIRNYWRFSAPMTDWCNVWTLLLRAMGEVPVTVAMRKKHIWRMAVYAIAESLFWLAGTGSDSARPSSGGFRNAAAQRRTGSGELAGAPRLLLTISSRTPRRDRAGSLSLRSPSPSFACSALLPKEAHGSRPLSRREVNQTDRSLQATRWKLRHHDPRALEKWCLIVLPRHATHRRYRRCR